MSGLVWVELDAKAPEHNLRQLRAGAPRRPCLRRDQEQRVRPRGGPVAPLLPSAEWFGVNSLEEGLELRALGITSRCSSWDTFPSGSWPRPWRRTSA